MEFAPNVIEQQTFARIPSEPACQPPYRLVNVALKTISVLPWGWDRYEAVLPEVLLSPLADENPLFSSKRAGREIESLLLPSTWVDALHKVFGVTLQRAVSLLRVCDHNEP